MEVTQFSAPWWSPVMSSHGNYHSYLLLAALTWRLQSKFAAHFKFPFIDYDIQSLLKAVNVFVARPQDGF